MTTNLPAYLAGKNVHIRNPSQLMKKLELIHKDGKEKLQIISDFDYTLSRFKDDEAKKLWTTHAIFDNEVGKIDAELAKEMYALRDKYMPIEFDEKMTREEKIPHMITWWSTAHDRISKYGFTKEILRNFVSNAQVVLRRGVDDLISTLQSNDIPLVVFSAGLGDVIKTIFEQRYDEIPENVHLISNMMVYDDSGTVVDFAPPLIHTFNKNSTVVDDSHEFFDRLSTRSNVILMGDSLGDLAMDTGVVNEGEVLKIGFLNFDVERLMPKYLEGYDIVLVEEHSMDVPRAIISATIQ